MEIFFFIAVILGEFILLMIQGEKLRNMRHYNEKLSLSFEEVMERIQKTNKYARFQIDSEREWSFKVEQDLETMTTERDRLLAGAIHDVELEMVFKDEADADDYIASRKRAVEAFEKVTEEVDMSGPEWDDDTVRHTGEELDADSPIPWFKHTGETDGDKENKS